MCWGVAGVGCLAAAIAWYIVDFNLFEKQMNADSTSALALQLASSDPAQRADAAEKLAQMAEAAAPAAAALASAAGDEEEVVREWAVGALESMGPPDAGDLDRLAALLEAPHADVAYWAATLIGRLEGDAVGAVKPLAKVLDSQAEDHVRQRAAWALGKIGPAAVDSVPALEAAAQSSQPRLARAAQQALESVRGE